MSAPASELQRSSPRPRFSPTAIRGAAVLCHVGRMWQLAAAVLASTAIAIPFFRSEVSLLPGILGPSAALAAIGFALSRRFRAAADAPIGLPDTAAVVVSAWLGAILTAAVILMLTASLSFSQAIFEATSGLTTTGLSVVDVSAAPSTVLYFRSTLQLAGGLGLAILAVAVLGGSAASGLSESEGRPDRIVPNIAASAALAAKLYAGYTVVGVIALLIAGMGFFDAVNHAYAAISTGGFSTRPESVGAFPSVLVEVVLIVLMFVGATNFLVAHRLMRDRGRGASKNEEIRTAVVVLAIAIPFLFAAVTAPLYESTPKAVRAAVFEAVSALTTTGYQSVSYADWAPAGWFMITLLMIIGGGAGSTAGGVKLSRLYVGAITVAAELRGLLMPRGTVTTVRLHREGRRISVGADHIRRLAAFCAAYLFALAIGALVLMAHGFELGASLFEAASALGTAGLSVGVTSASNPPLVLWSQSWLMLLGRLEIFALLVGMIRIGALVAGQLPRRGAVPCRKRPAAVPQ
jgi:trk system potassium uptake protein TrkH